MSRPHLVVISGPSGAGKSSLIQALLQHEKCRLAVSATTRAPRKGEVEGVHYRFLTPEAFENLRKTGHLLEFAEVHGHLYGTITDEVDPWAARSWTVILDVDVQGYRAVRASRPETVGVFIAPPSLDALRDRLLVRGTEDSAGLARRLDHAQNELSAQNEYDHVIVNDEFAAALARLEALLGFRSESRAPGPPSNRKRT